MTMEAMPIRGPIKRVEKVTKARKKNNESPRMPVSVRLPIPKIRVSETNRLAFTM